MKKRDPFATDFLSPPEVRDEYQVVDPHPEPPPAAGAHVPYYSARGHAYLVEHWKWKLHAKCPRCGDRRFVNIYDVGAGYGAPGCQIGICGPCGEDLKLARPKRRKLPGWQGG